MSADWIADHGAVVAIIAVCSVIQSLFGVGLLVFGTPSLLLLGFSFEQSLATLLPTSMAISATQVIVARDRTSVRAAYFLWSTPFVLLAMGVLLYRGGSLDMKMLVGCLMLLSVGLRMSGRARDMLRRVIERRLRFYLATMGFVHGLSNMGGALLTILMASRHPKKTEFRLNIATVYFIFASAQMIMLALLRPDVLRKESLLYASFGLVCAMLIGNRFYAAISEKTYQALITFFMFLYGSMLVWQGLSRALTVWSAQG